MFSFDELYKQHLENIMKNGSEVGPRGMKTRELLGAQFVVNDAREVILLSEVRDLNYRFMIAEAIWIIAGDNRLEPLLAVNSKMAKFSDDGKTLAGAYGPRLESQDLYIIRKLREDPDTRQAVSTIWTPNPARSKDIPCTIAVQFFIRNKKLCSIWTMRSSDAWLGLPYDIFSFAVYQSYIALLLGGGIKLGSIQINMGSAHIYEKHYELAFKCSHSESESLKIPDLFDVNLWSMALDCKTKSECLKYLKEVLHEEE